MKNIFEQKYRVSRQDREAVLGHRPLVIWFTGLSGSGKSTIANLVELELNNMRILTYTLDGDNVRGGLNKDLNFSESDRKENIRRIAEVAKLFVDSGVIILAAFISPYKRDREMVRDIVDNENFIEVYINTSIKECEKRDVKGLYRLARAGEIKNMTGIDAPYEPPSNPDIEILTEKMSIKESVKYIVDFIKIKLNINNG